MIRCRLRPPLFALLALPALLAACASDLRAPTDPAARLFAPEHPLPPSAARIPDPTIDPRCTPIPADPWRVAYRCDVPGISYVLSALR